MEGGAKSAKAKVEARPTVTGRSRKVDGSTGLQLKQRLAEALEQHAAISEILQGDLRFADRHPAGARHRGGERGSAVRVVRCRDLPARSAIDFGSSLITA